MEEGMMQEQPASLRLAIASCLLSRQHFTAICPEPSQQPSKTIPEQSQSSLQAIAFAASGSGGLRLAPLRSQFPPLG